MWRGVVSVFICKIKFNNIFCASNSHEKKENKNSTFSVFILSPEMIKTHVGPGFISQ